MFDEKSSQSIRKCKQIIEALFWVFVIFGVFVGLGDCTGEFLDFDLGGGDDGFLDFSAWVLLCGGVGSIQLIIPMLMVHLMHDVWIIRQKLEAVVNLNNYSDNPKPAAEEKTEESVGNYNEKTKLSNKITLDPRVITCPSCGKTQYPGKEKCFNCGSTLK